MEKAWKKYINHGLRGKGKRRRGEHIRGREDMWREREGREDMWKRRQGG
jgi:hypothetical protein